MAAEALGAKYGQIGGTWIYPMKDEKTGDDLVSIGFVVDLDYADATRRPTTCCSSSRRTRWSARSSRAASASPGAPRRCPGGGYWSMPKLVDARRAARRRRGGHGRHGRAQGRPPRDQVGHPGRRGDLRAAQARATDFSAYEEAVEESLDRQGALRGPQHAPALPEGLLQGGAARQRDDRHQGQASPAGAGRTPRRREADVHRRHARTAIPSPTASTRSTSSRASSSRATRPATTRRTTSACRRTSRARWPRRGAGCARPASTRSPTTRRENGDVDVIVNYTNCVQCGAITAKGGRLTTPEGGDGPLYQIT